MSASSKMVLWDSLFLLLVALPALTGGLWWSAPHFHVEYTEPGAAAALLALWLWRRGSPERSRVCRGGQRLWRWWLGCLSQKPARPLAAAWAAAAALWFTTALLRHRSLNSGLADLGIFTNAIRNVGSLGFPFSSLKGGLSLLTDHQIFLLYPLGWLFPLWPSPAFLLLLQAFGLTAGGVALYLLGRQRLGAAHPVVPWLPFLYWLAGPLRAANRFDFHPEVFMLPLFLFSAWLLQERAPARRVAGAVLLLVALAAKESAGPLACGIGLAWLLGAGPAATRGFTRRFGVVTMAAGLAAFVFDSRLVPSLFGFTYAYGSLYAPLPPTAAGLALAPFTQPGVFFGRLASWSRLKFFCGTLLPEAFLPLLVPFASLAAVPGFLMLFLSAGDHRISLGYHYAIEPLTGLLFALPAALDTAFAQRHAKVLLPVLMLAGLVSTGRGEPYYWRIFRPTAHQEWLRDEIVPRVAGERSVVASYALVPHLAARRWVNQPESFNDDHGALVDCLLLDPAVPNSGLSDTELAQFSERAHRLGYRPEFTCGTFSLLARPGGPACLSSPPPPCPEPR